MAYSNRVQFEPIRSAAFGAIGAAYAAVGTATTKPARLIRFVNDTDEAIYISLNGTDNHIYLPASGFLLIDVTANKVRDHGYFFAEATTFYAKRVSGAPSSGSLYIEVMYAG